MSTYISQLNALVGNQRAQHAEQERARLEARCERLTPLADRLARVLSTIPMEIRSQGLALPSLRTMLRGRQHGNCHCGELGEALRRLGYQRRRNWGGADGFHTLWYPSPQTGR